LRLRPKFDADGEYIRRFLPELKKMPVKYLHQPWEAPGEVLAEAGVKLGEDYPKPIVKPGKSREQELKAFSGLR